VILSPRTVARRGVNLRSFLSQFFLELPDPLTRLVFGVDVSGAMKTEEVQLLSVQFVVRKARKAEQARFG